MEKVKPLKEKPLRQPGQSLQERIDYLIDEKAAGYIFGSVLGIYLALQEWWVWYFNSPPKPVAKTIAAVMLLLYFVPKIFKIRKEIINLKLGRDGEKIVAEVLDQLKRDGCIVFHDLVGESFNIDHVVLSPKGIYLIETKTYSKPKGRRAEIKYDGNSLLIDGRKCIRNPISQAKAASVWLYKILLQSTSKKFFVQPVILFPGWYVHEEDRKDIMILNPERLQLKLSQKPNILEDGNLQIILIHLSRYIRAL